MIPQDYYRLVWRYMNNDERFHAHTLCLAGKKSGSEIIHNEHELERIKSYKKELINKYYNNLMQQSKSEKKPWTDQEIEKAIEHASKIYDVKHTGKEVKQLNIKLAELFDRPVGGISAKIKELRKKGLISSKHVKYTYKNRKPALAGNVHAESQSAGSNGDDEYVMDLPNHFDTSGKDTKFVQALSMLFDQLTAKQKKEVLKKFVDSL